MRLKYLLQSICAVKLRWFFNLIYFFRKTSSHVIAEIYYEAHLFFEMHKIINKKDKIDLFKHKKRLPQNFGIGLSERIVELPWFLSRIKNGNGVHLDAGSSINFSDILFHSNLRSKYVIIENLNPERNCYWTDRISYIFEDLRKKIFMNDIFDSISCLSTLEHIGLNNERYTKDKRFQQNKIDDFLIVIKEFKRILKNNGECFITVPYGRRKNLKWLQIFNKQMVADMIKTFEPSFFDITFYKYTTTGWQIATEKECQNCSYSTEYPGDDFCVGAYAVACLRIVK